MVALTESRFLEDCFNLAPLVLVAYDTLLTFSREVNCIWRQNLSSVTVLYVTQRYCKVGLYIMYIVTPPGKQGCAAGIISQYVLSTISSFGVALFSTLRVWGLCGRISLPVVVVFMCSVFTPCLNLYNYSRSVGFEVIDGTCYSLDRSVPGPPLLFPVLARCVTIVSDILVLAITWRKTADMRRATVRFANFQPKLSLLLFRDGTLYFVALFVLNVVTLLLDILMDTGASSDFITVNEGVGSVLIARFILDLRSALIHDHDVSINYMSSIRFTTSVVGAMASPLGLKSTWVTAPADDIDERAGGEEDLAESDDMFLALEQVGRQDGVNIRIMHSAQIPTS